VAAPQLTDPNFHRTVVLVVEHDENGSVGLVLNRPAATEVSAILPQWGIGGILADPPVVFVGGPVAPDVAIGLARLLGAAPPGADAGLVGEHDLVDLAAGPDEQQRSVRQLRVFVGYAGWGPGQLQAECRSGAWFVVPAQAGDLLSPEPQELWRRVLRRQPGRLAMLASFPADPAVN
jgi:putative transcriptional regulator